MNKSIFIKKGQSFKIKETDLEVLGKIENSNQEVRLPVWILDNKKVSFEALDDEEDGYVLIKKRKLVELDSGKRVLADIYIKV